MCEFGVKVLVSSLLVAVLSEALPCGRHNSPINEIVTTQDTPSSSPIPSHCEAPTDVFNATGVYLTPQLPYYTAMNCCYAYGMEPFVMRKSSKIDRQMFARAAMESLHTWYPVSDPEVVDQIFIFPNGTTVNDDNDAVFIRTRNLEAEWYECWTIYRREEINRLEIKSDPCARFNETGICINMEEFKEAYENSYDNMYGDQHEYETRFMLHGSQTEDEYFTMIDI